MNSTAQKNEKQNAKAPEAVEADNAHPFDKELSKKVRNSTKKLVAIDLLLSQAKAGNIVLNEEQKAKTEGRAALANDIKELASYLELFRRSQTGEIKT